MGSGTLGVPYWYVQEKDTLVPYMQADDVSPYWQSVRPCPGLEDWHGKEIDGFFQLVGPFFLHG